MAMFSSDPAVAKKQMLTVVFLLTAFGHMDGKFALSEKRFLQEKIAKLVEERVNASQMDPLAKQVAIERTTQQFQKVAAKIDREIASLYTEWATFPFIADDGLGYFALHLHELRPITMIMIAIGVACAFWLGRGQEDPEGRGD